MLTKTDVIEQREQMQEDIKCILDGIDDNNIIDNICQVIVDRCNILSDKINTSKPLYYFKSLMFGIKNINIIGFEIYDNIKTKSIFGKTKNFGIIVRLYINSLNDYHELSFSNDTEDKKEKMIKEIENELIEYFKKWC